MIKNTLDSVTRACGWAMPRRRWTSRQRSSLGRRGSWGTAPLGQVYKAETKEAVQLILNKLSLFMVKMGKMDNGEAEVVTYRITANPGVTSVDKKTVRKLDGFLSFFHSRVPEEKPGGVPRSVNCCLCFGTHGEPCNGYSTVPV